MFVGQTGIQRVIQRTCEVMNEYPGKDVRNFGAVPLEVMQKYINRWSSSSLDLFGAEVSSNAATFFGQSLKGRAYEAKNFEDHKALDASCTIEKWDGEQVVEEEVPLRNAMNELLREDYIADNQRQVDVWNRTMKRAGIEFEIKLPHRRFNRKIGMYAGSRFDVDGNPISEEAWQANKGTWLPTEEDEDYVKSLMVKVHEPGKIAAWIAPPSKGINGKPFEFEYVKL